ncbi:TerC family protein [Effusibacillus dendaii]|uniref:TerC family protein n=1 Tax=Effusibacillus dendaii TaxID=2743772 RepID=UPI00190987F9|nr:hypothetical protein [Effusibacillus dendaii]
MESVIHVFLLHLVTSIDNAFVIAGIIKHSVGPRMRVLLLSIAALTVGRTVCILFAQSLASFPGLKFISGLITFLLALKMAKSVQYRKKSSLFSITFLVVIADLTISLDNILATAALSYRPIEILGRHLSEHGACFFVASGNYFDFLLRGWVTNFGSWNDCANCRATNA